MAFDVVIIGAGPAGLSVARALSGSDLRIAVVEKQPEAAIADPAFDGREIALTHRSVVSLEALDAWSRIPEEEKSPLREARVENGTSKYFLGFTTGRREARLGLEGLGYLVPNHLIRRALYESVVAQPQIERICGVGVTTLRTTADGATVVLSDGRELEAKLVIAADTRFSDIRRRVGISASMRDFGKVMLVCRMEHELSHEQIATEWFDYGQTIAILPLNGNVSSAVLTLPARDIDRMMALEPDAFSTEMTERMRNRLGTMRLISTRHAYPLVAVYASRFYGERLALIGDAAVGMHPVTAHGFNFGLLGAVTLADAVRAAVAKGADIGAPAVLRRYDLLHRRATLPLYLATNTTALLYTDSRMPARVLREAALRVGNVLPLFRKAVVAHLTDIGPPDRLLPFRL